ncbi:unnamed protein product [marine sediment metagenome]|uniref:Uncharacterized protein n=1 Tax=marine sediment metagenome TaxID=412755 RepID=X0UAF8_9ZZZZ
MVWAGAGNTFFIQGAKTWDPGNIVTGNQISTTVTVVGAVLGDFVDISFSLDMEETILTGYVSAGDTVEVVLFNNTGGDKDLGEGTLRARVYPSIT